jgi:hypothetical protein
VPTHAVRKQAVKLPKALQMRATMFGSLKNGGHLQIFEDAQGLGIVKVVLSKARGAAFESTLTWESRFPGREFVDYGALAQAALSVPERRRARLRPTLAGCGPSFERVA